ncbi:MAG: glycosyltransferase family 4 protein [Flavobacteriaceae bacterium]|nr:glycosyltransferase family 4 protein [Flavobacteriaceae bacterium]
MKKVAYITSGKVGIHRFTYNEIELLEKNGIEINLCLTQLNSGAWMPNERWNINVASKYKALRQFFILLFSKKNILSLLLEAKKKKILSYFFISLSFYYDLKKNNINSIHCQMGDDKLYIGYFLKRLISIPLTVTVHAHELYQRKVYDENKVIKELYSFCDKVITISDFNTKIINEKFGVEKSKIEVMRLFPDIDNQNYVKDKTKILIVANWVEKKGYSTLLKALKKLERDDFVLWIVGGNILSHDSIDVEKLVEKYNMKEKVAILGSQSSPMIDIIFKACDIFCLPSITDYFDDGNPSEREGIPVSLMEAMAWNKPVIATNHAGNSELIEKMLVEENNSDELSKAIEYLLDNKKEWKKMGERNVEIINSKYSKSNIEVLVKTFNNF